MTHWLVLDGTDGIDDAREKAIAALGDAVRGKGGTMTVHAVRELRIAPCSSCGACGFKSPGKCVVNDDIHTVLRDFAKAQAVVYLTPVRFGGYSSLLKRVLDRFMPIGMPLYKAVGGHLLHPMRYGDKFLLGVGIIEAGLTGQEEAFRLLVERNALNMGSSRHATLFVGPGDTREQMVVELERVMGEAM